ncbi:TonB-dependent receptor domain-containing protein [Hyalangium rubrum]|uniref:TonB-dependent receptor n=1 Tax=Hyalangium rubrum TaxID=3103134 RepID=A0ABU5GWS2_9BACT|nr:TonB-dependent receptor [Hyalangium sp. s54d21]MDY7225632.1 TonB-dependent receptor [Hyalangium sp. s54d21]
MPKHSARKNKNTALAVAVLVNGAWGVAAAQEAAPPAPVPTAQETAPAAQEPAATPVQQPVEATQPEQAVPAAPAAPAPAPAPAARPAAQPAAEEPPPEEFIEDIVVTGSRIPRKELTTAAPVTVLDKAQIEATGRTSIGEILQNLPEQSNAINTQFNNGGDGATRVNLRGLGSIRTLVLLNGRRHVAGGTGADATVDLNSIPTVAIQRIEILKDGGSAVYGSDAIAGVVNIITRKDYSGTELRGFTGISGRGDGLLYDLSLTTGQSTERGNILFTAGYYTQKDVFAGDRSFSKYDTLYDWNERRLYTEGSSSTPEGYVAAGGTGGNAEWTALRAKYPTATRFTVDPGTGEWRPFNTTGVQDAGGDLYNYQPDNYLVTPQQRAHVYSTGGLRLGSSSRAFFEASYTNRQSSQQLAAEPLFTLTEGLEVSGSNVYNPFGRNFSDVRRRLVEFGTRDYTQDLTTFRVVTGVEGKFNEDFGPLNGFVWDIAYNYGRTQGVSTKEGLLQRSRLAAAIGPSFLDPDTGVATCGTVESPVDGCVPLNLFGGQGSITKEMADYLSYRGTARGLNTQTAITANFAGELFKISSNANPTGVAVGYEHRREGGAFIPDPLTAKGDTTGNKGEPTEGRYYVNEAYAELSVPVLGTTNAETGENRDLLEFTGAARVFDYNTFGSDLTYKFGGRFSPIPDVTLRGTYSTAFRAPAVGELFSGSADSFPSLQDPCSDREQGSAIDAACDAAGVPDTLSDERSQQRAIVGGNINLKPETAKILTLGVVFQPRFLNDVTATVDYYNINVTDAVSSIGSDVILNSCYPREAGQAPQYCSNIERNADGLITLIRDPLDNVGGDATSGIDLSLRYQPQTAFGRFGFSLDATYLGKFDRTLAGGTIIQAKNTYDLGGVYTDWKANLGVSWAREALSASANMRFINGFKECEFNSCSVQDEDAPPPIARDVKDYYTFDANVAYDWETKIGTATAQVGVNNVFDAAPAIVVNGFLASSDAATYDYLGRYFYLRLSYNYY